MIAYPQLRSGALAQYPIRRTRLRRTIMNQMADDSRFTMEDPGGNTSVWSLTYESLTDDERTRLETFFQDRRGRLRDFTFLDPAGNLLAYSARLDASVWQQGAALTIESGVDDPNGGQQASRLKNPSGAVQGLSQTISAPGEFIYCFSCYVRSAAPATVAMSCGSAAGDYAANSTWRRLAFTGTGSLGADDVSFGLSTTAAEIEVFGLQVEAQPYPSPYQITREQGGVYSGARFQDDELSFVATDRNRHSCVVNILHADHL